MVERVVELDVLLRQRLAAPPAAHGAGRRGHLGGARRMVDGALARRRRIRDVRGGERLLADAADQALVVEDRPVGAAQAAVDRDPAGLADGKRQRPAEGRVDFAIGRVGRGGCGRRGAPGARVGPRGGLRDARGTGHAARVAVQVREPGVGGEGRMARHALEARRVVRLAERRDGFAENHGVADVAAGALVAVAVPDAWRGRRGRRRSRGRRARRRLLDVGPAHAEHRAMACGARAEREARRIAALAVGMAAVGVGRHEDLVRGAQRAVALDAGLIDRAGRPVAAEHAREARLDARPEAAAQTRERKQAARRDGGRGGDDRGGRGGDDRGGRDAADDGGQAPEGKSR
ncbi:hypothetical protein CAUPRSCDRAFT_11119 [Caulochytrium protostelioides]|uniref:Uncharacterized protein n=1 Tax=Caulochytrium protostelioides TaxID=1555241 RepID=A0A4P9WZZ9_9FUNG|nr:hypothetical protein CAUPRSCDRAFT_11119 [Caulochytrium protostelioides]